MSSLRASFPAAVVTVTGRGQALRMTVEEEGVGLHEEVFVLDASLNPAHYARDLVRFTTTQRRPEDPQRTLVNVVPVLLVETGTHIFAHLPTPDAKGELFRCSGCGLVVHGRASSRLNVGAPSDGHAPFVLQPNYAETRPLYSPCSGASA